MSSRRSSRVLATLAVGGTAAMVALPAAAGAATARATTTSILTAAKAAIAKQTGVHLEVSSNSGSSTNKVVADLGTSSGVEVVTSGKATATIKLTKQYGYLGANSSGLTSLLGLTAAEAKKVGSDWISIKAGTSQYASLKASTTMAAVSGVLPSAKGTALSTSKADGKPEYLLKWTTAATSTAPKLQNTFALAAEGTMLPIEETAAASTGTGVTKFSKWGERVAVSAPSATSTIAFSKVTG